MAELIRRRRSTGFIGRRDELGAFRDNFGHAPEDERHRFLFHIQGNAGVGKTFLVRELEQAARERGALTAYVDESVSSVPEALAGMAEQLQRQGHPFKKLERLLATYRERRHEAESAAAPVFAAGPPGASAGPGSPGPGSPEPRRPSAGSAAMATAGVIGLGMVPVVGPFAGALDADRLASGADRLRATLSARFRDQADVQLVLAPDRVLTPVFVDELAEAAHDARWIALFFDTYERTAPFLDAWLRELMTTETYGALPVQVVVTVAGQRPFDAARWGGFADFMTELRLEPFTEPETRRLLAGKDVTDESVVAEILRLSGGLPVLVSTLAENQPSDPADVGDPSATAVERFLKWEQDPARRSTALACALPRGLDEDVFREVRQSLDDPERADVAALYDWLRALPFVAPKDGGVRYHDVVRGPMLRLQRARSPRAWAERHTALAAYFADLRTAAGADLRADERWERAHWRAPRFEETYHRLCAAPRAALADALLDVAEGCREGVATARRAARVLAEAGEDSGDAEVREWGRRLVAALGDDEGGVLAPLGLLLDRPGPGLATAGRAVAHEVRARELRRDADYERALVEYGRSLEADPGYYRAHHGRGFTHMLHEDLPAALADLSRADELAPGTPWILGDYGAALRFVDRYTDAVAVLDRAVAFVPADRDYLYTRGVCRRELGDPTGALVDFDRVLELDDADVGARTSRAQVLGELGELDRALAELALAEEIATDPASVPYERGELYRRAGRHEEAERELSRALALAPDTPLALMSRGAVRYERGRFTEALADYERLAEREPKNAFALSLSARAREALGDLPGALADLSRAVEKAPTFDLDWLGRGRLLALSERHEEAVADFGRALDLTPDLGFAFVYRGRSYRALHRLGDALTEFNRATEVRPEYTWVQRDRITIALAMGRLDLVRAELGSCATRYPNLARWARARLHLLGGQPAEALDELDALEYPDDDNDDDLRLRAEAQRRTGRWDAAHATAERLRSDDPLFGVLARAMTVTARSGAQAAATDWRAVERAVEVAARTPRPEWVRAYATALSATAGADRPRLDVVLAEALALAWHWDDLADLVRHFEELLHAPGIDTALLRPRLARLTAARDAVAARWA
ncbi:ATP-binding protein [Streptomyces corynorhini]|uniref:ATP-binding protein n=2 Tax=Streptomyces corynorhini TaxID=2282652 RepID=A0A370B1L6_9ACTN|nr:ATP-binding protein [Streptomyces corynorhini]